MAGPGSPDKSLLDRLNALKPSTVQLDTSTNALNIPTTCIQPLSREDALSKRLRNLRDRREDSRPAAESPSAAALQDPPPPYTEFTDTAGVSRTRTQPLLTPPWPPSSVNKGQGDRTTIPTSQTTRDEGELDDLFGEDDRTLDEILEGLDVEYDHWAPDEPEKDESERVAEILAKLRKDPVSQPVGDEPQVGKDDGVEEADDSDGEHMTREVENVISQAMDELELDRSTEPNEPLAHSTDPRSKADLFRQGDEVCLPTVPQDSRENKDTPTTPNTSEKAASEDKADVEAELSLPTVPTKLVDPAPPLTGDDFEDDIIKRMAALKGLGAAAVQTDAFGLPSVPTFQPDDRPVKGIMKRSGYTDEDQKTWCIVCLDDATVRCIGCDDDVFCARCWKDMHIGPSAGYDERGHQWVKFNKNDR